MDIESLVREIPLQYLIELIKKRDEVAEVTILTWQDIDCMETSLVYKDPEECYYGHA